MIQFSQDGAGSYDFETILEATEWAHSASLVFDTDDECQEEEERLLSAVTIKECCE